MNNIDILEELANNEHIRWSNWQKYVHSKCIKNDDGSLTIPKEYVEHWEYEINTDYANLPENIKESDRREVRQILEKLNYSTLIAENKELKKFKENIEKIDRKQLDKLYKDAQKALKEYRETQNKVAKLEEENKELKEKIKEINEEYNAEQKHEMENTIPKSKVEEEIERLDKDISNIWASTNYDESLVSEKQQQIDILQSLLGKE